MQNTRSSIDQSMIINLFAMGNVLPSNQPQVVIQQLTTLADASGGVISQMPTPMMAVASDFNDARLAALNVALASVGLVVIRKV